MKEPETIQKKEVFSLIALLFLILIPRFWNLSAYPPLIVDEPANLRDVDILRTSPAFIPGAFEWDFSMGMLVQYPTYYATTVIKDPLLALRTTSVIASLFVLAAFYLIVRRYTSPLIAWCTTLMFSSSYWFLQFSRVGWTNIHTLVAGLWMLWFLLSWFDHGQIWRLLTSAVCGGILVYTHRSGEVYLVTAFIMLFAQMLRTHMSWTKRISLSGLYVLIIILVSLPWTMTIWNNREQFTLRERTVSVFSANRPYHGMMEMSDIIRYQIQTSITSWIFFIPHDGGNIENPRYFPTRIPQISYLTIPLWIIGLVVSFLSFRRTLTVDPPNGSRALVILPIIYLFVGMALDKIRNRLQKISMTPYILISYVILTACVDVYIYSRWMLDFKV
jgi:4-amino-4-deoxy-L-arabinose transferase-like glycosyltransferase